MTRTHYERLSTLDASFLSLEDRESPMHIGSASLFDATPFRRRDGGLDFQRIEHLVMQGFARAPRLHQKVWWPVGGPPVWIDDAAFDPSYHFRRAALPTPGGCAELKEMCARILSARLDTERPLWEAWIVEGLAENRFALIWKLHHCLADGIGVRDILIGYLGFTPSDEHPKPSTFMPRPAPTLAQIYMDGMLQQIERTREITAQIGQILRMSRAQLSAHVTEAANGLVSTASNLLASIVPMPFNGELGALRRFDWASVPFSTLNTIRKQSGATINDIVLAIVCGALRTYLLGRGVGVDDLPLRVMVPVNMRAKDDNSGKGNHVSYMSVPLALAETDPRRRLAKTIEAATRAKASGQIYTGNLLAAAADWAGIHAPMPLVRLAAERLPANLVVTNIPGPQVPQYLGASALLASFPVVPLAAGQGLGVALYGYNQALYWGFNADRELVPDLPDLVAAVNAEVDALYQACLPTTVIEPKLRAVEGQRGTQSVPARASVKSSAVKSTAQRTVSSAG